MSGPPPGEVPGAAAVGATDLGRSGRKGARWGLLATIVQQGVSVLVTLVMARLLTPADFGIVAAALVVVNLLFTFVQTGFGMALVRREHVTPAIVSTTVWTGVAAGLVTAALAAGGSPLTTSLLGQPRAAPYLAVLGVYAGLNLATVGHRALLQRDLRFGPMYAAEMVWSVVYAGVAVSLAAATDLGAWSMVIGNVAAEAARGTVIVATSRFRPLLVFDRTAFREDLRFNAGYLGTSLASTLAKNTDNIAVSRLMGANALGAYYIAFVLPQIVRQRVTFLTTEILTPLLARTEEGSDRQRSALTTVLRLAFFVLGPALAGIGSCAGLVIDVAFGTQWHRAAAPLVWLSIGALFDTYSAVANVVMMANGHPGAAFRASVVRLGALVGGIVVVALSGPTLGRMGAAVMVSSVAGAAWYHRGLVAGVGWSLRRALAPVWLIAVAVAAMAAMAVVVQRIVADVPALVELAAAAAAGAATFLVALLLVDRRLLLAQVRQLTGVVRGR